MAIVRLQNIQFQVSYLTWGRPSADRIRLPINRVADSAVITVTFQRVKFVIRERKEDPVVFPLEHHGDTT